MAKKNSKIEKIVERILSKRGVRKVIATVSGGPDSMALLSALSASAGVSVMAAHCNFHLRGEESNRDMRAVETTCLELGVPFVIKEFDVEKYMAAHKGVSVEMACRELRFGWFRSLRGEYGAQRIATGHNANDNIETFFLNMLRGSGTSGLKAMLPDNGEIIRPLLQFSRDDILGYLKEKGIGYVTDSTNLQSDYRRNFLRNEVLPMLRSRWAGFDAAMTSTIRHLRDENRVVTDAVASALPPEGEPMPVENVSQFPAPELLVRRFIEPAGPFTTTASEMLAAIKANKPDVRRWKLKNGSVILRGGKFFVEIAKKQE